MMPGQTPFVTNKKDLERFNMRIEQFFEFAAKTGIQSLPLSHGTKI